MIQKFRSIFNSVIERIQFLPALLARITLGFVFAESGWGKLQHIDKIIGYFESLNIPFANIQAPFVAGCELVFGLLVLIGLFTRLASIPLIGIMVVAIMTAKLADIATFTDLFGISEFLYILLFLYLIVYGPGAISIDHYLCKRCQKK